MERHRLMRLPWLTTGYGLLEGPVWDPDQGLYFSDVPNGGVYRISLSGEVSLAIPHRRGIGGMAHHEAGGLVVGGRNVAYKRLGGERTVVLMDNDLTEAEDGSVWVALAEGSCVAVYESDGSERMRLPVPLPMVTSVCFGGPDLRDLYVVTGTRGGPSDTCGTVYRTQVDVPGLPLVPCRVAVS